MVNTVAGNQSKYTNGDYLHAVATRKLQIKIGYPSTQDNIIIIENNLLPNCPFSRGNVVAAMLKSKSGKVRQTDCRAEI